MFRARDSCGADVRRGRSPKCLFIKATATGNTINGLNDEINKLPEAGHGGAWRGLRWPGTTAGQSPRPASKPGPSPAPAALPAPQGPASLHDTPTPRLPLTRPHAGTQSLCDSSSRAQPLLRAVPSSPQGEHFWAPQTCHVGAKLGAAGRLVFLAL